MDTSKRCLGLVLAAIAALPLTACAHTRTLNEASTQPLAMNRAAAEPVGQPAGLFVEGVVDQFRIDPHGRVSGLLLRDGTELVAQGQTAVVLSGMVRPGDRIRTPVGPGRTLEVEDARSGRFVEIGTVDEVARGGGPISPGPVQPYAHVDDASQLQRIAITGRIRTMMHVPNGAPSGFVMEDGTQVHIAPSAAGAVAGQVSPGERIRVEGRGTHTPMGIGMWGVTITRPNNFVLLDMTRGIGAPELNLP